MRTPSRIVRCLFAAALVLTLLPTAARADGFGIGAKGGFVYSNLNFSNASDAYKARGGWQAGVFFGSKRAIGALVEFNYLERRTVDAVTGAKTTLQYIDLPTLLKINIGSGSANGLSFYVAGGPTFDFKIGDSIPSQALVQSYEDFDFGLVAAGGIELTRLLFEVRGQWGLRNIATNAVAASGDLHSRSIAILFGLRFH